MAGEYPYFNQQNQAERGAKEKQAKLKYVKAAIETIASFFAPDSAEAREMLIAQYGPHDEDFILNEMQIKTLAAQQSLHTKRVNYGEKNYLGTLRVAMDEQKSTRQRQREESNAAARTQERLNAGSRVIWEETDPTIK